MQATISAVHKHANTRSRTGRHNRNLTGPFWYSLFLWY